MKKIASILAIYFFFVSFASAENYYFKGCKLSEVAKGDYIINLKKNVIETTLIAKDGRVQNFLDKIKLIEKDKIVSEKIESGKGDQIYFEYYLNAKTKKVVKLQYKRQKGLDIDIFKVQSKKESDCLEVKADWNINKIKKTEKNIEQNRITEAQKKIKKEQSAISKCLGKDINKWTNCKGSYSTETGHKYEGLFKLGKIIKGAAFFPGGSKYVGDFKDFKPHGYGNFVWTNGDKYFGEWINGKSHGNGTKIWNDGREYSGTFKEDKLNGQGTLYYPDGKTYKGGFINGKRHGEGTFVYPDGSLFIGEFIAGKQEGLGECISIDGTSVPCKSKTDAQVKDFSGKNTQNISIVAKKWVRISQYETNTKKAKKVMDKLMTDFDIEANELCLSKGGFNILDKKIEVLDVDETPSYGLETKLKIGISGAIECKIN